MVSVQSGRIKHAKTLQSRLVATPAALSTLGDALSRPTKVFRLESPLGHFTGSAPLPCYIVVLKDWFAMGMSNRAGRIATMYSLRKRDRRTHSQP
jgi:hypothetical protein